MSQPKYRKLQLAISICQQCNKKFETTRSVGYYKRHPEQKRRFCNIACMYAWRRSTRIDTNCIFCNKSITVFPSDIKLNRGKYCSKPCARQHQALSLKGENHHLWKGDRATSRKFRTDSQPYRKWRKAILARDNNTCVQCGSTINLEVDHIKPKSLFPELIYDVDNGRTLCHNCHSKTPTHSRTLTLEQYNGLVL